MPHLYTKALITAWVIIVGSASDIGSSVALRGAAAGFVAGILIALWLYLRNSIDNHTLLSLGWAFYSFALPVIVYLGGAILGMVAGYGAVLVTGGSPARVRLKSAIVAGFVAGALSLLAMYFLFDEGMLERFGSLYWSMMLPAYSLSLIETVMFSLAGGFACLVVSCQSPGTSPQGLRQGAVAGTVTGLALAAVYVVIALLHWPSPDVVVWGDYLSLCLHFSVDALLILAGLVTGFALLKAMGDENGSGHWLLAGLALSGTLAGLLSALVKAIVWLQQENQLDLLLRSTDLWLVLLCKVAPDTAELATLAVAGGAICILLRNQASLRPK